MEVPPGQGRGIFREIGGSVWPRAALVSQSPRGTVIGAAEWASLSQGFVNNVQKNLEKGTETVRPHNMVVASAWLYLAHTLLLITSRE